MTQPYSKYDLRFGILENTTWGTASADNAAFIQLCCDPAFIPQGVNIRKAGGTHASRAQLAAEITVDQYLAMPEVSLKLLAKYDELDLFAFGLCQSVVESNPSGSVYKKIISSPSTQPDFATSNGGLTLTFCHRDPISANSWKLKDAIVKSLELACKSGEHLGLTVGLVGRGAPIASTPSGTWTRSAESFWNFATINRKTVNYGAGAVAHILKGFNIKLEQQIEPIGQASGDFQNYAIPHRQGTFDIHCSMDSNYASAITALKAGTQLTFNIAWDDNSSAGDAVGDLDMTFYGKLTEVMHDGEDNAGFHLVGEMVRPDTSTAKFTLTMANSSNRGW